MADFVIRLSDERGHVTERIASAGSEADVRQRFLLQGLVIVGVKPRGIVLTGKLGTGKKPKVKLNQFVVFNQQLVTLLHAGLPILTALELLEKQQSEGVFRDVVHNVREHVKSGELLSDAMQNEGVFPKMYTATLLAGEKSGNLEEVLNRYVHFQRLVLSFQKKLRASLIYPVLLIGMVVVMLSFLVTFVVPRFAELYGQLDAELPAVTQFMLEVGVDARQYAPLALAIAVILPVALWRWTSTETGAHLLDRLRLALPLVGVIWLKYQVSMFSRILSTLLAGGIPLVPALQTAGASLQSRELAKAVTGAAQQVYEGRPLASSLEASGRFPHLSVRMVDVGESTGALPQMLTSVAEFYEEDVENALAAALSLIEPLILIVMAVVVGFVLISLYMPIFKLGNANVIH
jgi:type IV pilus assembly protein PilC